MLGEHDWKSMNFPKIFWILTGIPRQPFKVLQNSGIRQDLEPAKVWNPTKTATAILGNPEIFKYPIQCRP